MARPDGIDTAYWKIVHAFADSDIFEEIPDSSGSPLTIDRRKPGDSVSNDSSKRLCNILEEGSESNGSPRTIDRRKLGDIIFKDSSKRRLLNSITHPLIIKIMLKQIISTAFHFFHRNAPFAIIDIPLLFEAGFKMKVLFGVKVVVAAPHYLQLNRLIKRNPELSIQQCEERIAAQMPVIEKVKMADISVWNTQTVSHLEKEVEKAMLEILNRKRGYLGLSMIHFILFCLSIQMIYVIVIKFLC